MNTRLTLGELTTVAAEVETILNSRPLTPLSSDPSDYGAITPGHLLIGKSLRALPERQINTVNFTNPQYLDVVTAIKQDFWRRWSSEYINELRARTKWSQSTTNINIGSLVIIHDDNRPSQHWKFGRIEAVVEGKDGLVRVAHLRTPTGYCSTPVHKLALIPTSDLKD
ncbi:uncharacterized protein [Drosophila takahashii]|uniref:uncharacterized protein n=1 Tax=Drosophila takahashii TaxID=29030 RepID=UPI003898E9ED